MACAFVAGLLEDVHQLLRAGSRMEMMRVDQLLLRERAVLMDDSIPAGLRHVLVQC